MHKVLTLYSLMLCCVWYLKTTPTFPSWSLPLHLFVSFTENATRCLYLQKRERNKSFFESRSHLPRISVSLVSCQLSQFCSPSLFQHCGGSHISVWLDKKTMFTTMEPFNLEFKKVILEILVESLRCCVVSALHFPESTCQSNSVGGPVTSFRLDFLLRKFEFL